ncbi:MAG: hypothetical protein ABW043_04910 [Devosia sp.]|uniref:DUF7660 family protein n=1 Tax=Devosia sp. TaxID=1871048 RepID=UPI003395F145
MTGSAFEEVTTREQLASFVEELHADLLLNAGNWDNRTLEGFLGAMAAWVRDSGGLKNNLGTDVAKMSSWTFAAAMLTASVSYE